MMVYIQYPPNFFMRFWNRQLVTQVHLRRKSQLFTARSETSVSTINALINITLFNSFQRSKTVKMFLTSLKINVTKIYA